MYVSQKHTWIQLKIRLKVENKKERKLQLKSGYIDDITAFDAADLDRDLIAERLKKDDVGF